MPSGRWTGRCGIGDTVNGIEKLRRTAARRAGGNLYNYWPANPMDGIVPGSFHVSSGIFVSGTSIQTQPTLRAGRSFSVREVAGVIVGPCDGSNVLYNARNEELARFGMSDINGLVFVRYLKDHGVPFYGLNGEPFATGVRMYSSGSTHQQRFTMELQRTYPIDVAIMLGMFLGLALCSVGLPIACCLGSQLVGPVMTAVLGLSMLSIVAPWIIGAWKGELLFPPMLSVEGETVWIDRGFHPLRELSLDEIAQLRYVSGTCYELCDKRGRVLAKFSTQDDFGPEFMEFLKTHNIKPRFDK